MCDSVTAGGLAIATVAAENGELLFSPDGTDWTTTKLPTDMTDTWGWHSASGAATDRAVLLLLWDDQTGGQKPIWWLGTLP